MVVLSPAKGITIICEDATYMKNQCIFDAGSNSHRVFYIANVPAGQTIWFSGMVIRNGKTISTSDYGGGGVYMKSSSSIFENTHFLNNQANRVSFI